MTEGTKGGERRMLVGKKGGEDKDGQGSKGKAHLLAGKVRVVEYGSAGVRERLEKRKCWGRTG